MHILVIGRDSFSFSRKDDSDTLPHFIILLPIQIANTCLSKHRTVKLAGVYFTSLALNIMRRWCRVSASILISPLKPGHFPEVTVRVMRRRLTPSDREVILPWAAQMRFNDITYHRIAADHRLSTKLTRLFSRRCDDIETFYYEGFSSLAWRKGVSPEFHNCSLFISDRPARSFLVILADHWSALAIRLQILCDYARRGIFRALSFPSHYGPHVN